MWAFDPSVRSVPFDPVVGACCSRATDGLPGADGIVRKERAAARPDARDRFGDRGAPLRKPPRASRAAPHRNLRAREVLSARHSLRARREWAASSTAESSICSSTRGTRASIPTTRRSLPATTSRRTATTTCAIAAARWTPLQAVALTHYDRRTRKAAYAKIERLLSVDNPAVYFWWQRQQEAISVDFHGFAPNPVIESWNAWQWSI